MSLADALSAYLTLNFMIVIGGMGLGLFAVGLRRCNLSLGAVVELRLHYAIMLIIFAMMICQPLIPGNDLFSPALKIWSAPSLAEFDQGTLGKNAAGFLSLPSAAHGPKLQAANVVRVWSFLGLSLLFVSCAFIFRDLARLFQIQRHSFLIRRVGCVRIFISDTMKVPFSFWVPGRASIIVPSALLEKCADFRMAVAHELQHHRHGDTGWVYVMWILKWVCPINPAIYVWNRWISELQEFACDETLVDQNKVESQAYARCLVEVAQSAINQKYVPVCATGLTFLIERNLLKRRIEKMLFKSSPKVGRSIGVTAGILVASMMGIAAFASKALVQDRRVDIAQAKSMAARTQSEAGFPLVINESVLKQLNRFIGTPEGRLKMKTSLQRMKSYRPSLDATIQKYGVPSELIAIPITESEYLNLDDRNSKGWGAGLWMFIKQTARVYGLKVDEQTDERLDVELATDAAIRYLQSNYLRFKDWHLAVMAYNMGENAVQRAIDKTGSRDAWTLIRAGHENDSNYLAKVIASVLIMRNPETVD